jgi:predicted permease
VARVPPLLGRYFNDDDEREGAPPMVVIGYSVWQSRFAGQPDIIGRTLQLGATPHTVIGVMPEGFAFPINNRIWTPLRLNPSDYARGDAPDIDVFGRLAATATLADAQTQLTTIGQRLAATFPESHQYVQPRILPYARAFIDSPELVWVFHLIQLMVSMLLVVIGTNVAILVYARTATRMGEIAVRSALGASRARIVSQLFAEALVLSTAAALLGLAGARFALDQVQSIIQRMGGEQLPFWMDFRGISLGLVVYVAGLAVVGAVIVGVLPALRATRRDVHANLQQLSTAGSGMHLGKIWTVLIVTQVAVSVVIMPFAFSGLVQWVRIGMVERGFAAKEFLTASVQLDREGDAVADARQDRAAFAARFASLKSELVQRLEAEPGVSRVVLLSAIPGDEPNLRIEAERLLAAGQPDTTVGRGSAGYPVGISRVDTGFFDAFDIPVLLGREFAAGDVAAGATAVIVNRSFVQKVFGGADPLGRRVRRVVTDDNGSGETVQKAPWYEIVGVVPDFPNPVTPRELQPKLYQPMTPTSSAVAKRSVVRHFLEELEPASAAEDTRPVIVAVRVRGASPETFADRLREMTLAVDPMLRLGNVGALDRTLFENMAVTRFTIIAVALVTLSVLLLSAAGIYALMSFTINRRRREIGIRAALGAGSRNVLWSVLSSAMRQIAIGIVVGLVLVGLMQLTGDGEPLGWSDALLLFGVAAMMTVVGLLASIGPARRALAIPPSEALRADG